MDFELSEEQRAFQQTAREFSIGELAPHAAQWDAEGIFPKDVIARAGELGFCGLYRRKKRADSVCPAWTQRLCLKNWREAVLPPPLI